MDVDPVGEPVSQSKIVVRLEILGRTLRCILPRDVDSPEVVVLNGNLGENGIQGILDELDDAARVLGIDLTTLGFGNSQETQSCVPIQRELHRASPYFVSDLRVDGLLIGEGRGIENRLDFRTDASDLVDIDADHPRKLTAGTAKIEGPLFVVEEFDPAIPVGLGPTR